MCVYIHDMKGECIPSFIPFETSLRRFIHCCSNVFREAPSRTQGACVMYPCGFVKVCVGLSLPRRGASASLSLIALAMRVLSAAVNFDSVTAFVSSVAWSACNASSCSTWRHHEVAIEALAVVSAMPSCATKKRENSATWERNPSNAAILGHARSRPAVPRFRTAVPSCNEALRIKNDSHAFVHARAARVCVCA